jgi:hypothetical protein
MKLIAHRGLINGPNKERENHPDQIKQALQKGYDCEIDIRWIDNVWYLGHDNPDHPVPYEFLEHPGLWIHAKNLDALYVLGADTKLNFFWHQEDDHTLTSQGYIWTYPGKGLTENSVMVMPEWEDATLTNAREADCYAVCSDFVELLK